jgi:hypothetical protein
MKVIEYRGEAYEVVRHTFEPKTGYRALLCSLPERRPDECGNCGRRTTDLVRDGEDGLLIPF